MKNHTNVPKLHVNAHVSHVRQNFSGITHQIQLHTIADKLRLEPHTVTPHPCRSELENYAKDATNISTRKRLLDHCIPYQHVIYASLLDIFC